MLKPDDSMDTGDTGENSVRFHPIWKCQSCWVRKRCGTIVSDPRAVNIYEGSSYSNSNLLLDLFTSLDATGSTRFLPVFIHYF